MQVNWAALPGNQPVSEPPVNDPDADARVSVDVIRCGRGAKEIRIELKTLTVIVLPVLETHTSHHVFRMTVEAVFVQPDHAAHFGYAGTVKVGATKVVPPWPKPPAVVMQKFVEAGGTAFSCILCQG